MQLTKFRVLSAITAGSLALAVVATTASSGNSPTATHAALAAQTEPFSPVNLDDCPVLHTGYPTGGCVAKLQTDLNIIQGNHLAVDGTFGSQGSQTYNAVIAFQQANGLPQDGLVGPATKQAVDVALSVPTPTVSPPTVATPEPAGQTSPAPPAAPTSASGSNADKVYIRVCGIVTCSIYYSHQATVQLAAQLDGQGSVADVTTAASLACSGWAAATGAAPVAAGCLAVAVAAFGYHLYLENIQHAADTAGCVRFRSLKGTNNIAFTVYADHSTLCHSMDT
jgi:peptidoglycan hydrolase-like protein with peptidoglycan-binding domain